MDIIEPIDYRVEWYARVAGVTPPSPSGEPSFIPGEIIYVTTITRDSEKKLIGFITPSPFKMAMNIAINNAINAAKLRKTIVLQDTPYKNQKKVAIENLTHLYDFFEFSMISITFCLQAIDTYCNDLIEKEVKGTFPILINRKIKHYNSAELQRETISPIKKLEEILPKICSKEPISKNMPNLWKNYLDITEIRNKTLHLKAREAYPIGNFDKQSLFYEFFKTDIKKFPNVAIQIIEYFEKSRGNGPWLEYVHQLLK